MTISTTNRYGQNVNGFGGGFGYGELLNTTGSDGNGCGYGSGTTDYGLGPRHRNKGYGCGPIIGSSTTTGSGFGDSSGIEEIEGHKVYLIDFVPTIIYTIKGDVAKAATLRNNVEIVPCYVAKVGGCFAHGDTAAEALRDAEDKYAVSLPVEERVAKVYAAHPDYDAEVSNEELFRLHHVLTGSCEFGRRRWCEAHGIDLNGHMTMREFCVLTADAYGGDVIDMLMYRYTKNKK